MNRRLVITVYLILVGLMLSACELQDSYSGRVALKGSTALQAGEVLNGELLVTGGRVQLNRDSRVTGSVFVLAGTLETNGAIDGDLSLVGGRVIVGPHTHIGGDLTVGGGTLERSSQAQVAGGIYDDASGLQTKLGSLLTERPVLERWRDFLVIDLILAGLAYLAARFLPRPVRRVARAATGHGLVSGALGILVVLVAPALLVMMAFTMVLIPFTVIGILFLGALAAYGLIAIGLKLGLRIAKVSGRDLRPAPAAFWGTLVLMLFLGVLQQLGWIGAVIVTLVVAVAIGAVLLTRFGMRTYVPPPELSAEEMLSP
jgi:hypothetical protein